MKKIVFWNDDNGLAKAILAGCYKFGGGYLVASERSDYDEYYRV